MGFRKALQESKGTRLRDETTRIRVKIADPYGYYAYVAFIGLLAYGILVGDQLLTMFSAGWVLSLAVHVTFTEKVKTERKEVKNSGVRRN